MKDCLSQGGSRHATPGDLLLCFTQEFGLIWILEDHSLMRYITKVPDLAQLDPQSFSSLRTSWICHAASSYHYCGLVTGAPVDSLLHIIHLLCEEEAQRMARRPGNDTRQPYSPAHCPQWESYSEIRGVSNSKHARSKVA